MRMKWMVPLALVASCSAKQVPVRHEPEAAPEPYRPDWTAAIALQIDEIRACLRERPAPTAVIHLQALANATGVTAVDGLGHIENCAVSQGQVLVREPSELEPADLEGLPLFALAPDLPSVPPGVPLEEVAHDEAVLGWLYWPTHERGTPKSAE